MKKLHFLFLFSLILPAVAWSQATTTVPPAHPSLFKGTRPLGMGNAFLAMPGSDENAPFYNPAAINDYEKFHMRLVSPTVDFTTASIALVKDVLDLVDDIDAESDTSSQINTFQEFVNAHTGEFHAIDVRLPILMAMSKWFAAGILADSRTTISFRNRAFSNFELLSRSDVGGFVGTAYNFKDLIGIEQNVQAGVNVKVLHRVSVDQVLTTDDIIATTDFADALPIERATGVGVDLGLKGEIPTFELQALEILKPTAAFTWQDIGNTKFTAPVPDTEQSISLGLGVHPSFHAMGDREWKNHFEVDLLEINQPLSFSKKFYVGYELEAPRFLILKPSIRVGAGQLYFATGATFDLRFLKLDVAYYGEEVGRFTRQGKSNRLAAGLSIGF